MMLDVINLSMSVKQDQIWKTILKDISFSIAPGEVFALIGESGSGKSMTALSMMRLLPPNAGYSAASKIMLHGQDILNIPEKSMRNIRGADIAMIFQDPMNSLNPIMTVGKQILEVLGIHSKIKGRYAYIEALRLFDAVKIPDPVRRFNSYPHELSGGMQQRAMIAMALACKPSLLIADEPTTALDVTTQAQILALLKEIQDSENMAILLITHDLAIASQMADKVAVMQAGKIVEENTAAKFFAAPQNPYSQKLLLSLPSMFRTKQTDANHSDPILTVQDLRVYFPIKQGLLRRTVDFVKAVDGIEFTLYKGQTLAIVGESGSGKSTVAKALVNLLTQATGNINYLGPVIAERSPIQIIFQDPYSALNSKLRIIDSLEEGLLLQKDLTAQARADKIDQLLQQVGLSPARKLDYPHQFSGGERQRICIARALTVDPKIIICDEPTSSLDVSVQAQVLRLLQELQQEHGLTYLFISHDLKVVSMLAHYVAVMQNGKIVEHGTTQEVLTNPQHPYTKTLLAAVPQVLVR